MLRRICGLCLLVLFLMTGIVLAAENVVAGSEQARVTSEQIVTGQDMADAAAAYIRQRIGVAADSDAVAITLLNMPQDVVVPAGALNLTVELPYGVRYNTPTNAAVSIVVGGRMATKVNLQFEVRYYQQVVVASRAVAAHEPLIADALRYERVDVGRLAVGYITDIDKAVGLAARRPISPGTVINKSLLEKPVIIKRGNVITIVARTENIEVSASGQALQNGVEGQLIQVQNMNSRKIITARVLNDTTVLAMMYNGR